MLSKRYNRNPIFPLFFVEEVYPLGKIKTKPLKSLYAK
jgi:hypothetical protein